MKLKFCTPIHRPLPIVKAGFQEKLFRFLNPPWMTTQILRFDGCSPGHEIHLLLLPPGLKLNWVSLITRQDENANSWSFTDEGKVLPWPLRQWKHQHRVDRIDENSCEIVDEISYETFPAFLGPFIHPMLWATFAIRPRLYKKFFEV